MRVRTLLAGACGASLALASAASAQYTGNDWQHVWDFENGLQGWTITNAGAGTGTWIAPGGNGPVLPDGQPSGYGSGSLYLPDGSYARISLADVTSVPLGADGNLTSGMTGFILQADAYLPNLRPLTGFPQNAPGNALSLAGLGVGGTRINLYVEGRDGNNLRGLTARDFAWDNTARNRSNVLIQTGTASDDEWWDAVITFQIDYGYTTPGKWTAYAYVPFDNQLGPAGWYTMSEGNYDVHPDGSTAEFLQLGGQFSWTQAQFDNVKLHYVPEPATLGLLALGAIPMLRRRRHA